MLPEPVLSVLAEQCRGAGVHFTDVGAYYLLMGVNQARANAGEPPLEIPAYMERAARAFEEHSPAQEPLLAG